MMSTAALADHAKVDVGPFQKRLDQFAEAWGKHDAKAMSQFWTKDGDIINPMGRQAWGQAEIEKLFNDEHTTFMKESTFTVKVDHVRMLKGDLAWVDATVTLTGMKKPDGTAAEPMPHHLSLVMTKKGKEWLSLSARPYVFVQAPPAQAQASR
jgi:uncharacterized protein (TIGR02246 family)